jgi:YVTN family beta-propeller protein
VTDLADDRVWRIDAVRNSVVGTIPVGDGPTAVAETDEAVWVANRFAKLVSRIEPKTNTVVATIQLGREPRGTASERLDLGHRRVRWAARRALW